MRASHLLLSCLTLAGTAGAQSTWYVDANAPGPGDGSAGNPYTSIAYAIQQGSTASGDTLLCAPGTYEELVDYSGKSLAIRSSGGSQVTTILVPVPSTEERAVAVRSGEGPGTLLEGFTLTGDGAVSDFGVGIHLSGATLELRDVVIDAVGNESDGQYVGLYAENAQLTATDLVIENNKGFSYWAPSMGLLNSTATFTRCVFENNYGYGGVGARIVGGDAEFVDSAFRGNRSQNHEGAGILADQATLHLVGCELSDNQTLEGYPGGALFADGGALSIDDCTFASNVAERGGAVFATGGASVVIRRSTFVENTAIFDLSYGVGSGGALFSTSPVQVERCVFVANRAGGDWMQSDGRGGAIHAAGDIQQCSFYGNTAFLEGDAVYSSGVVTNSILRGSTQSVAGGATVTWSDVEGGHAGTGNIDQDPLFVDPLVGDLRLQAGSPCIDAGDPASPPDEDGSRADMGALPYGPAIERYCVGKVNSQGCTPGMLSFGTPTLTSGADDFVLAAKDTLNNQFAVLIWGYAEEHLPLFGGTLCVGGTFVRTPPTKTGGSFTGTDCTGAPRFSFTQAYMAAHGIAPYDTLYAQWWSRDPGFPPPLNASLSDGLRFSVLP